MKNSNTLLIIVVVLMVLCTAATGALLLKGQGSAPATAPTQAQNERNTLAVSGTGKETVNPNVGYIELGVETNDKDVKTAQKKNADTMADVVNAVKALGLEDADVQTTRYNIYPRYDYKVTAEGEKQEITHYEVQNMIKLRVKDLGNLGKIIDAATEAGANQANSVYFDVLDRESVYNNALTNAVEAARQRAEIIAAASNLKIVGVVSINESGSYNYYARNMDSAYLAMSAKNSTPIEAGEMDITANVNVVFEVAPK